MVPRGRDLLVMTQRPRSGVAVRVRDMCFVSVGVTSSKIQRAPLHSLLFFYPMDALEEDHNVPDVEEEIHEDTSEREAEASGGSDGEVVKEEEVEEGQPGDKCCVCGDDETEEDNPLLLCDGVCGMGEYQLALDSMTEGPCMALGHPSYQHHPNPHQTSSPVLHHTSSSFLTPSIPASHPCGCRRALDLLWRPGRP